MIVIDQGKTAGTSGTLTLPRAVMIGGQMYPGPSGTITHTEPDERQQHDAARFEFRPSATQSIIGPTNVSTAGTGNGTLDLNNALRTS